MSSTLPLSQPATAAAPTLPDINDARARASGAYDRLCALRDPSLLHSAEVHGFASDKSFEKVEKVEATMEAVSRHITAQCNIPAERIQRVTHLQPHAYPSALHDKVLVDLRDVRLPSMARIAIYSQAGSASSSKDGGFA
ncbi:hypothetical protein [Achromobacter aloeverae]|uniref:Uncharacterized protein n=1 Tax=Achromobacter aloeverae TaxID=1750518 RepID=A0A4Q1HEJ2_9BURK|nr:hypothetical protein [Achromobacter aloeverae]RXN84672.1 hypothetical protein C7R54_25295 [Achromobacter aloeverae]